MINEGDEVYIYLKDKKHIKYLDSKKKYNYNKAKVIEKLKAGSIYYYTINLDNNKFSWKDEELIKDDKENSLLSFPNVMLGLSIIEDPDFNDSP